MDRKTQKIKIYLEKYLEKNRQEIKNEWDTYESYEDDIFIYNRSRNIFFKDEIIFFLVNDIVEDITITEYFLGNPVCNIFYYREEDPQYRVIYLNRFLSFIFKN